MKLKRITEKGLDRAIEANRNGGEKMAMEYYTFQTHHIRNKSLAHASFYWCSFRDAYLYDTHMYDAKIKYCDLTFATLNKLWLERSYITGSIFYYADLRETVLFFADISNCDMRHADLRGADLRGATLTNVNLEGANLEGADLRDVKMEQVDLTGANLEGAIF